MSFYIVISPPDTPIHWFLDGRPLGTSLPGEPFFWPMTRGRHLVTCAAPGELRAPTAAITVE